MTYFFCCTGATNAIINKKEAMISGFFFTIPISDYSSAFSFVNSSTFSFSFLLSASSCSILSFKSLFSFIVSLYSYSNDVKYFLNTNFSISLYIVYIPMHETHLHVHLEPL